MGEVMRYYAVKVGREIGILKAGVTQKSKLRDILVQNTNRSPL